MYKVKSRNRICRGKAVNIISCVLARVLSSLPSMQRATILASAASLDPSNFSTLGYLINVTIFGKKGTEQKCECFDFLYSFHLKYFSFQQEFSEMP
jgi:hypothetical protein